MKKVLVTALLVSLSVGAFAQVDPSRLDLDSAELHLAGPDSVYVTNIDYAGQKLSVLLRYNGSTGATIYGPYSDSQKFLLDSFELGEATVRKLGNDSIVISDLILYGAGVSGQLQYDAVATLDLKRWWQEDAPLTTEQQLAALEAQMATAVDRYEEELAATKMKLEADLADAQDDLEDAKDDLAAAQAEVSRLRRSATVAAAGSAARPGAATAARIDPSMIDSSLIDLSDCDMHLAGPDSVYVTSIKYDGVELSVILKYDGQQGALVYGPYFESEKFLLDSFEFGHANLRLPTSDTLVVSDLVLYGTGISGRFQFDGVDTLNLVSWRETMLRTDSGMRMADSGLDDDLAAAEARLEEAMSDLADAQRGRDAAMGDVSRVETDLADAEQEIRSLSARLAVAGGGMAATPSAAGGAGMDPRSVDPSQIDMSDAMLHLAGPDSIYITDIEYSGVPMSVLLKYDGSQGALIYGPYFDENKLLLDSFELGYADVSIRGNDTLVVSDLVLYGSGVSGRLKYDGVYTLNLDGWWETTPPVTSETRIAELEDELDASDARHGRELAAATTRLENEIASLERRLAEAEAAADEAIADADAANARAARAQRAARATAASIDPNTVDASLIDVSDANLHLAGPDAVYVTDIEYGGVPISVLLKYDRAQGALIYGPYTDDSKLLLDDFELGYANIRQQGEDTLIVSDLILYGSGVSGRLEYDGVYTLNLDSWWETMTPTTTEMQIAELRSQLDAAEMAHDREIANLERRLAAPSTGTPVAAVERPTSTALSGTTRGSSVMGNWGTSAGHLTQSNSSLYFAKYGIPYSQRSDQMLYSFSAQAAASGTAFVGYGLHIVASGNRAASSYGYGNSYLIWVTKDPAQHRNDSTYVQVYRSFDDINMTQVASVSTNENINRENDVEILYDRTTGLINVSINGTSYLTYDAPNPIQSGTGVAFRTLGGPVTFGDFDIKE